MLLETLTERKIMRRSNCFTVTGSGIQGGIPYYREEGSCYVGTQVDPPLPKEKRLHIHLQPPPIAAGRILTAQPRRKGTRAEGSAFLESPTPNAEGYVFFLDTTELNCGEPLVQGLDVWPGAEWHDFSPFWSMGLDPDDTGHDAEQSRKHLVVCLKSGERCLITALNTGIRILTVDSRGPDIFPATPMLLGKYLLEKAQNPSASGKVLHWANKNIIALAAGFPEDVHVKSHKESIGRLYARTRPARLHFY